MKKLLLSQGFKKVLAALLILSAVIALSILFVQLSLSAKQIEVDFEVFGGENLEKVVYSAHNYIPLLPNARKDGYYFEGWFLDTEYTQPIKKLDTIKKSTTLYAKYALREYTITYHNGDRGDNPESYNILSNDIVLNDAVSSNQTFIGWYANDKYAGAPIKVIEKGQIGNLDLYARWSIKFSFINLAGNFSKSAPELENGDNINQYVEIQGNGYVCFEAVPYSNAMTYELWVSSDTVGNYFVFDHRQGQLGLALYLWADGKIMVINGYGTITESNSNKFKFNNQWHHLAISADENSINLFCNGELIIEDLTNGIPISNCANILCLGNNIACSELSFIGCLDELRVWSIKREQADISQYRFADYKEATANLVAYCSFNQHEKYVYNMEFASENITLSTNVSPKGESASLKFNGSYNYATTADMQLNQETTWEVWVQCGKAKEQIVLDHRKDDKGITPILLSADGTITFSYNCIEEKTLNTEAGAFQFDNKWHHIAVSASANTVQIYYDGNLVAISDWGIIQKVQEMEACAMYIGCKHSKGSLFFEGNIDEVRIFDTARSQEEIQAEMSMRLNGINDNLIIYLDFDNNLIDKTSHYSHCYYQDKLSFPIIRAIKLNPIGIYLSPAQS